MAEPIPDGTESSPPSKAFCIFIESVCEGRVPLVKDERGNPFLFLTRAEAERDIVETMIIRLQQCLDGERDFDDAIEVEEFIVKVSVLADGTVHEEFE